MTVHELGLQPYTGRRLGPLRRILAITAVGIRIGLRRRFLIIAMLLAVPLTFLFGVLFHVAANTSVGFAERASMLFFTTAEWNEQLGPNYSRFDIWAVLMNRHLYFQLLWTLIVIPWVGPSLLADDFQTRALTVYFSKPITRTEYLLGKWLVLAFFVACVTAIPSTVLYAVSILLCRDLEIFSRTLHLVPAAFVMSGLVAMVGGFMMMAFSASGWSRRFAAVGWLMTVVGSWAPVEAAQLAPHWHKPVWVKLISFRYNIDVVGRVLFRIDQQVELSVFWSLGVLLAVGLVSLAYVWQRVRSVEGLR